MRKLRRRFHRGDAVVVVVVMAGAAITAALDIAAVRAAMETRPAELDSAAVASRPAASGQRPDAVAAAASAADARPAIRVSRLSW